MKQVLTTLLILLLAFPWFTITAGACPMRTGKEVAKAHVEPMQMEGSAGSCEEPDQNGCESHHDSDQDKGKSAGCNGNCCPVCHLVQDTPQDSNGNYTLTIFPTKIIGSLPDQFAPGFFLNVTHSSIYPSSARTWHLKNPLTVPLRI